MSDELLRALFYRGNTQQVPHNTIVAISWDSVEADPLGCYSGSFPSRIVVPDGFGITHAKAVGTFHLESRVNYAKAVGQIAKNGGGGAGQPHMTIAGFPREYGNSWAPQLNLSSAWLPVVPGDYFELLVLQTNWSNYQNSGDTVDLIASGYATWLEVEFRRTLTA